MTDRGGGWQRDTPTIFTSTMSICSVDTRHLPATVQLQLYYMNMRIKATLENRIDLQVHTHGGTSNITSFDLVPDDTGIENYIQHWESLDLIWVIAT